jgi:uncharacterized membrane protein
MSDNAATMTPADYSRSADPSLVTYTHVIYALHALSVLIGAMSAAATVVGAFILGVPSIVAVVMNYVRRSDTTGTYLESHFSWQNRTFWFAVLWIVIAGLVSMPLVLLLGLGIFTFLAAAFAIGLWVIYRVVRGWLALRDGKPMPTA